MLMVRSGRDKSKGASEMILVSFYNLVTGLKGRYKNQYSDDMKLDEFLYLVCILESPEGKMIPKCKGRQHKSADKERTMRLKPEKKARKAEQAETSSAPGNVNLSSRCSFESH